MTKFKITTFLCLILLATNATAYPINEMPMYGNLPKTKEMRAADAKFIRDIERSGYTRQDAAKRAINRGWSFLQNKDYPNAMHRFNQAWLLDPQNGNAYHGFALVLCHRDNAPDEAEQFFRLAISKPNTSINTYVDYGRFLWVKKRYNESLAMLNQTLKKSPTAHNARAHISHVYYLQGDYKMACQWAQAARANNDDLEPGYLDDMCRASGPRFPAKSR